MEPPEQSKGAEGGMHTGRRRALLGVAMLRSLCWPASVRLWSPTRTLQKARTRTLRPSHLRWAAARARRADQSRGQGWRQCPWGRPGPSPAEPRRSRRRCLRGRQRNGTSCGRSLRWGWLCACKAARVRSHCACNPATLDLHATVQQLDRGPTAWLGAGAGARSSPTVDGREQRAELALEHLRSLALRERRDATGGRGSAGREGGVGQQMPAGVGSKVAPAWACAAPHPPS